MSPETRIWDSSRPGPDSAMDSPAPIALARGDVTIVATTQRQALLGDVEDSEERRLTLVEETNQKMERFGDAGITKPKQVLDFVRNLQYKTVGGQQFQGNCMFCNISIHSTGATRVVCHLVECVLATAQIKKQCAALVASTATKRAGKTEHTMVVAEERDLQVRALKVQKVVLRQQGIKSGFKSAEATFADQAIGRFFFANGLNFAAADTTTESFYCEMVAAIQAAPPTYAPPNARALSGPLLDDAHAKMLEDVALRDDGCELSRKYGVTYTSDGWDSCDNLPLINSAYILANDGGVYQRSVDTSGKAKNAEYCASLMIVDIYDIGCTKVVMLVTDTCAVMRKCWKIVEDEFPWISCAPCQTHCPSLLLTDICKLPSPTQTIKDETLVVGWFTNHHKPLDLLRQKVKTQFGRSCELKKAGATRMGTNTGVGERLEEVKSCLQQVVVDPAYIAENYKDLPPDHDTMNGEKVERQHKGGGLPIREAGLLNGTTADQEGMGGEADGRRTEGGDG